MVAAITAPIIAALTPALGATGAAFAVNATLYVGVSAASYFIQQAMQPKPETGTKLRAASGGAVSMSMLVGEKESAGSLIYAGSWGKAGKTPNGYYVRVYVLADLPCTAMLERTWGSGNKYTLDLTVTAGDGSGNSMGNPVKELRNKDGNDFGWVKFLDGTQTSADNYLRAHFGSDSKRPWTADMIGRGRALMIVTERYNKKEPGSLHEFAGVFQGAKKYDWRKDSTNGGSGSHRWGDRSTYEYSANPVVIAYNIMRGIYWGNTWLYGGSDWPARRFDNDTWTAAANICDENVSLAAGGTEKRYRMGAEIQFSEQPLSVIDRCLAACNGRMVESGGIYKVYAGGIGASVYSFADDDVVITEGLTGKMFPGREDICNTISGSYVEPDNGGQMKAYTKRTKTEYVDADGGEVRPREMSFDYVRNNRQAQRLSLHALNDNRRFMTKVVAFPSSARKLEPGDVVNWLASDRFGFVNKKFIAGDVTLADNGVVLVVLREADATDADWSTSDEATYTVGVYGDIVPATQVISITATAATIKTNGGKNKKPAIKIAWAMDADDVDWKRVRWRVRLKDTGEIVDRGTVDADELQDFAVKGIVRNENYQAQAIIVPESDRDTDWCAWINVTAPNVKMDGEDIGALGNDNIDTDAVATKNIRLNNATNSVSKTGKSVHAYSGSSAKNSSNKGNDTVIGFAFDNENGSVVTAEIDVTLKSVAYFGGAHDALDYSHVNGVLTLVRVNGGTTKVLRSYPFGVKAPKKGGGQILSGSKRIRETVAVASGRGTFTLQLKYKWQAWIISDSNNATTKAESSVKKASLDIFYGRR